MVLGESLEEDEYVYYFFERNMKRGRIMYSFIAMLLCVVAVVTLYTMIIPLFCLVGVFLCFVFGVFPRGNAPIAWVLTNKRYLCLYMNPQMHEKTEIRLEEYIDIEPLRENLDNSGGSDLIAELVMAPFLWVFASIRDYFQNQNKKTSKKYWADSKGITLLLANEERRHIDIGHKKSSQRIGMILSLVLENGWEHVSSCSDVSEKRTISIL